MSEVEFREFLIARNFQYVLTSVYESEELLVGIYRNLNLLLVTTQKNKPLFEECDLTEENFDEASEVINQHLISLQNQLQSSISDCNGLLAI